MMSIKDNQYKGVMRTFIKIAKTESPRRLFRGIGVVASGAGPAHALYFSCYEFTKKTLSGNNRSNVLAQGEVLFSVLPSIYYNLYMWHIHIIMVYLHNYRM